MRVNSLKVITLLLFFPAIVFAQCKTEQQVKQLDAQWEKALLKGDINAVAPLLHDDFVWVHNHASSTQKTKAGFLSYFSKGFAKMATRPTHFHANARTQRVLEVIMTPTTAVIYGFTDVLRGNVLKTEPDVRSVKTYHFMRTYSSVGKSCLLVANHTMLMPNP